MSLTARNDVLIAACLAIYLVTASWDFVLNAPSYRATLATSRSAFRIRNVAPLKDQELAKEKAVLSHDLTAQILIVI
jgi:hypothetical protein